MAISYNNLWKLLIDKNLKKLDLRDKTGISSSTLAKMSKNEPVALIVLEKICLELGCNIGDVLEFVPDKSNHKSVVGRESN
jgi:putative transcriptional regulator